MQVVHESPNHEALKPPKLRSGDRVRFVSPAGTPSRAGVQHGAEILSSWGLEVEIGEHVFDEHGYLAGTDADRAADLNDALRDPSVRAVFATRGGKGAYRIVEDIDFDAVRRDPKLVVGFSETTILHLALWRQCRLAGLHGPMVNWNEEFVGEASIEALREAVMTTDAVTLAQESAEPTATLTTSGTASGFVMGGNLDMIGTAAGWTLPSFDGAILFIEDVNRGLGHIDRILTRLVNAGCLNGVQGVAVGQFTEFESVSGWTIVEVLRDRLSKLNVPVLGGLPIGHGNHPPTLPLGTAALLDADAGTLTVDATVA